MDQLKLEAIIQDEVGLTSTTRPVI